MPRPVRYSILVTLSEKGLHRNMAMFADAVQSSRDDCPKNYGKVLFYRVAG